ncbi:unnamed protein product [Periconia digitata]|uniref:Xylanolytic transcriptional activator regulatory domain-containing protein n=1 Tax=Periconia digitata TaxID=1303443 RepID=A0A9W4US90_9PLEO|nr:unnamed protein product [Periconia digitata]
MSTMITFAANNEFFRKRKRVHRACESCKKRRKRCSHTFDEEEDAGSSTKNGQPAPHPHLTDPAQPHPDATSTGSQRTDAPSHGAPQNMAPQYSPTTEDSRAETPPNFLGYLNPEAVLREQVHSERGGNATQSPPVIPSIGQWIEGENRFPTGHHQGAVEPPRSEETGPAWTQETKVQRALHQWLDAVGVSTLPPRKTQDALCDLYFEYVHPLLPLIDKNLFTQQYNEGRESRILMQAICIVASKHADAASYLCLADDPRLMGPREFSHRLYNAVIAAIEAKLEKNRVILIQVLALISLHCEGPDGAEQASMHLAQAIHHAHTFGLQFGHQWKNQKSEDQENLEDVFWCLWSLDKINACMHGRPLIMHDRDSSLTKLPTDPEKRQSPFGVWLQISEMLDRVIDYYRPGRSAEETGWEGDDFLGFEEMVGDGEDKLEGPIMSLLSLFHHTMCMASHKSLSINAPVKSTPSYTRQSLSATRVIHLLNAEAPERLPPLPLVPYALSVALSVVYRHFRSRRLKVHINRATEEIKQCVTLLNKLRPAWWSAGTMADLGMAVLNNADRNTRAANTPAAAVSEQPENPQSSHQHHRQHHQQQPQFQRMQNQQQHSATHPPPPWPKHEEGTNTALPIDPRLQQHHLHHSLSAPPHRGSPSPTTTMTNLLNPVPTPPPTSSSSTTSTTTTSMLPGQHPTSSERISNHRGQLSSSSLPQSQHLSHPHPPPPPPPPPPSHQHNPQTPQQQHLPTPTGGSATETPIAFDAFPDASPDWLNFDTAFENFEGLLGSSGADLSHELFRPLGYEGLEGVWLEHGGNGGNGNGSGNGGG